MDTRLRLLNDTAASGLDSLELRWYGPILPVGTQIALLGGAKKDDLDIVWAKVTGYEVPDFDPAAVLLIDLVINEAELAELAKANLEPSVEEWFADHGWTKCKY